jgi:hypothetical protein
MGSWTIAAGTCGVVVANVLLVSVRAFAQSQGLQSRWWSRSYAPERALLRKLASSGDRRLAHRARIYLRLEILAWLLGIPSVLRFLWGAASR